MWILCIHCPGTSCGDLVCHAAVSASTPCAVGILQVTVACCIVCEIDSNIKTVTSTEAS